MKFCRVCGVEGRALCFSCRGKIAAASPRSQRALKARNADPKFKAALIKRMKKMQADPKFKAALSERAKKMQADPKFKAALSERAKKQMKKMNADPKFKAALIKRTKKMNADPKIKAALIKRTKKMHADPKFKAALSERAKKIQANHPEIRLNGRGKTTTVDGHLFPSKVQADVWSKLREIGGEPVHEDVLVPISTPFGNTFPDTMLGVSVLDIPAGIPIEIKDEDGSWEWSEAQVWAVENGETILVCAEDLAPVTAAPQRTA